MDETNMLRYLHRTLLAVAVLPLALAAAACEDGSEPPTAPTPPNPVTETFSGTVNQNGASTHDFAVGGSGTVTATLKTIGADNTLVVGFSLGNWTGTACSIVLAKDDATGGTVLSGTMTASGNLCVRVYDVGNVAANVPAAYSVEITHP
jgi:hypothetical protein